MMLTTPCGAVRYVQDQVVTTYVGNTGVLEDRADSQGGQRGELGGLPGSQYRVDRPGRRTDLQDGAVTGAERGGELPSQHQEGELRKPI
jgi:hypothetical protein